MATPPTFVAGQPLTAAQMNTIGMHLIKTQTVGTAVSSVTITGAFSADYDNYRITYEGGVLSTTKALSFQLSGLTSGYYGTLISGTYAGVGPSLTAYSNAAQVTHAGGGDSQWCSMILDVTDPYLAKYTRITGPFADGVSAGYVSAIQAANTSVTGFVIGGNTATMTGGTIRVYGYRNSLT